jgi:hypothetical protein
VYRVTTLGRCAKGGNHIDYNGHQPLIRVILLPGAELPLVESFGLLNDLFPFRSFLDEGYPVLDIQLANVLFDVILPSVLGSSL